MASHAVWYWRTVRVLRRLSLGAGAYSVADAERLLAAAVAFSDDAIPRSRLKRVIELLRRPDDPTNADEIALVLGGLGRAGRAAVADVLTLPSGSRPGTVFPWRQLPDQSEVTAVVDAIVLSEVYG